MKKSLAVLAMLGLVASPALASYVSSAPMGGAAHRVALPDSPSVELVRSGPTASVSIAGSDSWDPLADVSNDILLVDVAALFGFPSGTPMVMNGIGWDVTVHTFGASWRNEATIYFDDNIAPDGTGLHLTPGTHGSPSPAAGTLYSSGGVIKLAPNGIPDILLPNGVLRLEFYEYYDDVADSIDADFLAPSTLTIQVTPEPASLALLGLGAVALLRRRR